MQEYKVIFIKGVFREEAQINNGLDALATEVERYTADGWRVSGNVSSTVIPILNTLANVSPEYLVIFSQAIVREKKQEIEEPKIPLSTSS